MFGWGVIKRPRIDTVLHWRPLDVLHILGTDPSLFLSHNNNFN